MQIMNVYERDIKDLNNIKDQCFSQLHKSEEDL